jgi:tetratricopeptide (TPR) repeat protein
VGILACTLICVASDIAWIEVKSPNFVVVSDASQKQARRTARSLEQFRSLLQTALPKLKVDSGSPLIAFALRDEKSFKALLPTEVLAKGAAMPGGLFLSSPERYFVLLRTDAPGDLGYHAVYHEYVHLVMRLNFPDLPLWLDEGLAEFFGYARVLDGESDLGMPSLDLLQTLKTGTMIPLAALLEVTHDSPYYREQGKVEMFYAQSWALTHYLMIGDKQAHAAQLSEFLKLLQNDVPEQEAAKRALGNPKDLERNLDLYVRSMAFYHYQIPAQLSVNEGQYTVRTLSDAESLASRGEVLVHVNRLDDARKILEQALQLDRGSALANEGMGMLYTRLKDQEKAGKYFAAAAELNSKNYLANYYAAHAAFERGDPDLVENYLRKALAINPNFVPALQILSEHLAAQREKLPEALELSQKAASLEPADLSHRIRIASILAAMERDDEASALAEKILAIARKDVDRDGAQSLLSRIQERRERLLEAKQRTEERKEEIRKMEERRQRDRELDAQLRAQAENRPQEAKAAPIKTGSVLKAAGLIRSVQCDYPAIMDVVLDSNGNLKKLRADNYYQVQYWAVGVPGKTGFEPCDELEGKRVEIEFMSVSGQEYSGLIRTVAIQK